MVRISQVTMKQIVYTLFISLLFILPGIPLHGQGDPVTSTDSLFRIRLDASGSELAKIDLEIARYHLNRNNDSLLFYTELLEKHLEKIYNIRIDAFIHKFRAFIAFNALDTERSIELNNEAMLLFKEISDFREMGWINMELALNYFRLGDFAAATEEYIDGLAYFEEADHERGVAEAYNGLGRISYQTGQLDKAREYFESSLEIFEDIGNEVQKYRAYNNLAILFMDFGEVRKALDYMFIANEGFERLGDQRRVALVYGNIAIGYEDLGRLDSAMMFSRKALQLSSRIGDKYGVISGLINLGYFLRFEEKYDSSLHCFERALQLSIENKLMIYEQAIYEEYSELYAERGNYREAYHYHILQDSVHSLISDEKTKERVDELMLSYQQRMKEKELLQLKADQQMQKRLNNIFLLLIMMALIVVLGLIYGHRRNVSQRRELQEKNDLLSKYNTKLEKSEDELRLLNKEKNKLFSIVAHDLRNPIAALAGFTGLLTDNYDELDDETRKEYIRQISTGSSRSLTLLENLLLWARSQMDLIKVKKTDVLVSSLVKESINDIITSAERKSISIEMDISEDFYLCVDTVMIKAVLRNLITNAIKFSFRESVVRIRCLQDQNKLCIAVIDHGTGINKKELENLFMTGANVSREGTANETGSGLGLLISKDYTEKNGGSISVTSEPGEGSTFTICFPVEQ